MPASEMKLTYFDLRARGEITRMLFALAEVKYEDNRVTGESWTNFKPSKHFTPSIEPTLSV